MTAKQENIQLNIADDVDAADDSPDNTPEEDTITHIMEIIWSMDQKISDFKISFQEGIIYQNAEIQERAQDIITDAQKLCEQQPGVKTRDNDEEESKIGEMGIKSMQEEN